MCSGRGSFFFSKATEGGKGRIGSTVVMVVSVKLLRRVLRIVVTS